MSRLKASTRKLLAHAKVRRVFKGDPDHRKYIAAVIRRGRGLLGAKEHRQRMIDN